MNGGQITFIGNATDLSGVPSWGQVQQAIIDGSGGQSYWLQSGTSIYYNTGNVGIGNRSSDYETIPLCYNHHLGAFSIHNNKLMFEKRYGTEEELLTKTREKLNGITI